MSPCQPYAPCGTPAPRSTECTTNLLKQKSLPTVGWIRVVPCQRVDSQLLLTQYSVQSWHSFARIATQVPNSLPIWTISTCGSNCSSSYRQSLLSQQPPDRSILLHSPPRHRYEKAIVRTPIHLSFNTRHTHTQLLGRTSTNPEILSPRPVVLGEQATMEKTTQRFQKIATTLADLNVEGLNVQTVNDPLTMYVGCCQSARPPHELCA